jgi:hypothetical protein
LPSRDSLFDSSSSSYYRWAVKRERIIEEYCRAHRLGGTTANPEHLAKLKEGVEVWNQWRREHPEAEVDFSNADLSDVDLGGANLDWANLSGPSGSGSVARFSVG